VVLHSDAKDIWSSIWKLHERHPALAVNGSDIAYLITQILDAGLRDGESREIWKALVSHMRRFPDAREEILGPATRYASGDDDLIAFLAEASGPGERPEWEIKNEQRKLADDRRTQAEQAKTRQHYAEHESEVRAGDLRWMLPVAKAYLGMFSDLRKGVAPAERIVEWLGQSLAAASLAGLEATFARDDLPTADQISTSYAESRRWNFVLPLIAGVWERMRNGHGLSDLPLDLLTGIRIALEHEPLGDGLKSEEIKAFVDAYLRQNEHAYESYARLLIEPSLTAALENAWGLYGFLRGAADQELACRLACEWLRRFPMMSSHSEEELVDALARNQQLGELRPLYRGRIDLHSESSARANRWKAVGLLTDFTDFAGTLVADRDLLWSLRNVLTGEYRGGPALEWNLAAAQLEWIISAFRVLWPRAGRPHGVTTGSSNAWDASDFIELMITRLSASTTLDAALAFERLIAAPPDDYSRSIRHAAAQQRQAAREAAFQPLSLSALAAVVSAEPPKSTSDLMAVLRAAILQIQVEVRGSDTDVVDKYYRDDRTTPQIEDVCTDRLIEDIDRVLPDYKIGRIPQRDMAKGKRADITYVIDGGELPVECKGQWNRDLWTAIDEQLDALYVSNWRSHDRGLYLVYWFGPTVPTERRLCSPPHGVPTPASAQELREALISRIPLSRRGSLGVEVLDLSK